MMDWFHVRQTLIIFIFFLINTKPTLSENNVANITKPGCIDHCGDIRIPYPFGTTKDCYRNRTSFFVTCNNTFTPPRLFLGDGPLEITNISLGGQLKVLQFIASDCYNRDGSKDSGNNPWATLSTHLTVNNTANKFTIMGCDTVGYISGRRRPNRSYSTGCVAWCNEKGALEEGSCSGSGCCEISIPEDVSTVAIRLFSFSNYSDVWEFNSCGYAFFVEKSAFNFSSDNFTNFRSVEKLPMVVDWAIGNGTCEEAKMNHSTYACVSQNSTCYKPENGFGYRCSCSEGYQGNPYIVDGCLDINECEVRELNVCKYGCENLNGTFDCPCPKGYRGSGKKGEEGCTPRESFIFKLVAGIALGIGILLLAACLLYMELNRRKCKAMKQKHFLQNGGMLLLEKLARRERRSPDTVRIYSSSELHKATNDFNNNMIIGQGGFGTVYKGFLSDNTIVAIKKSKRVDPDQIEQFINEVDVLSQVNHRNVVRLLGCCFETEVPLLVYEFVNNGTLSSHVHNQMRARSLNWDMRLKIASETAVVLSYLHSEAATAIIHRDVKSDNILLDHTFTAKVSDFGASRLVPIDHTQLSTMVQGTFGYLDPEYLQTNQLTEKSDVYSFGVVLLELVTGRRPISFDKPEAEKNLANFFLLILKQDHLVDIVDDNIVVDDINWEQIVEVGRIAKVCLNVRGEDRPNMKEVAMELQGLRLGRKHMWARNEHDAEEETESLLGKRISGLEEVDIGNSTNVGFDSLQYHVILPVSGGR